MGNASLQRLSQEFSQHWTWAIDRGRGMAAELGEACRARGLSPRLAAMGAVGVLLLGGSAAVGLVGWRTAVVANGIEAAQIAQLRHQLDSLQSDLAATRARLALAEAPKPVVASAPPPELVKKLATLQASLKDASKQRRLAKAEYEAAAAALAKSNKEKEALAAIKARLEHKLVSLKSERSPATAHEADLATTTGDDAASSRTAVAVAEAPGFDLRRFLAKLGVRASGEGGPFVPAGSQRQHGADPQAMKILRSLPLSAPLAHYVVASPFGVRADPINEHEAFHTGLDFDAPYRSPIFNTAPGVVVFAGWAGAYGRMVEIDHGHGVHTRYCHLNRITVAMGQKLKRRVRIGLLGSTGRSTGPHVHYEVRVDGVPEDPEKFLRAGRSVVLVNDGQ